MDLLWKVSSKAKEILSQKEESAEVPDVNKPESSSSFTSGLGNEKPASSLSLETQQGNSDKEASPESENLDSEHSASPVSRGSDRTYEGGEESEPNSARVGLTTGDLRDVPHRAVESARSIGSEYFSSLL